MNEKRYLIRENNGRFNPRLSNWIMNSEEIQIRIRVYIGHKLNVRRQVDENLVRSDLLLKS